MSAREFRRDSRTAAAVAAIRKRATAQPVLGIVLGSGFQQVAGAVADAVVLPYDRLPGFPKPRVRGHAGRLLLGMLNGVPVAVLSGRVHYYEGYAMEDVTFPVRALADLGVSCLLLTNAAGGINRSFLRGDLMVIRDHINLIPENPLRGAKGTVPFVDLSQVYDADLQSLFNRAARNRGLRIQAGVYLAVSGPSYETPAEIRAFRKLGADAVGMSTVPEAIVARWRGMKVCGVSLITNAAAGLTGKPITHEEVLAAGDEAQGKATSVIAAFAGLLGTALAGRKLER